MTIHYPTQKLNSQSRLGNTKISNGKTNKDYVDITNQYEVSIPVHRLDKV